MRTITTPDALTMTVFTEVVRQGSFTAASRRLGIAKSAASKRVAALESSMGVKLLRRTTRKVVPTREGLTVFHATSRVVDAIADARVALDRTAASVGGAIRVSAPVTFSQMYLAPALARFTRSSPGVTVDLVTDDRFVDVVTGGFDLVVRIGRLGDGGYTARKLARTGVVICASPEYLARAGTPNPQISRGEDVVARIAYANRTGDSGARLQSALVDSLNATIVDLCRDAGVSIDDVYEIVAVGNTAMHHLLAGLPVRQLGESPYVPASSEPLSLRARDVGFKLGVAARLYLPPVIAGYVGSDHIAMLLAAEATVSDAAASGSTVSDAATSRATAVYVDIGTNTEITLTTGGRMLTCSCASGPAFEGAHIRDGMRASPGAIERVTSVDGELQFHVVGNAQPVGICGSGILDAIAVLRDEGVLDARGRLDGAQPHVRTGDAGSEYVLVDAHDSGNGRDVVITRSDVNEIQLAKGAIRAGIEILLHDARLSASDIDRFIVAGAFGTYLRIESAIRVGLFPNVPVDRVAQIGNAAGTGAIQMLLSAEKRRRGKSLPGQIEYVELTNHSRFQDKFLDGLFL